MQADPGKPRIEAAALIPIYRDVAHQLQLVLVRRSQGGVYGGQLAFPGGKHEPLDQSMLDTALREAEEEIGISRHMIEVLDPLPVVETQTTGFRIFPFLARVIPPEAWHRDEREIAEVVEVGLNELVRPEAQGETLKHFPTWPEPRRVPFYRVGGYQVWGVTYRMLQPLIPRLVAGEWDI